MIQQKQAKAFNIVITGGNSGIGYQTLKDLYLRGNNLIFGSRNQAKNLQAIKMIIAEKQKKKIKFSNKIQSFPLDLSKRGSIQNFSKQVKSNFDHIDILINNSGLILPQYSQNQDRVEMTVVINHFGHFYLTYLLFDLIKNQEQGRIINVSSMIHYNAKNNPFDDLNCKKSSYSSSGQYAISKFMNVVFTVELAKRMSKYQNIKTCSLHPGIVDSNFGSDVWMIKCFSTLCCCIYVNNQQGARSSIYLSTAKFSQLKHGQYYHSNTKHKQMDQRARNPQLGQKLWKMSQQMYGIKFQI